MHFRRVLSSFRFSLQVLSFFGRLIPGILNVVQKGVLQGQAPEAVLGES